MATPFDYAKDRPEHIENILNGLDRYNPETTNVFQDYVTEQCDKQEYDCYANLALLKLYQFNPHLSREDTVTAILTKALTVFPSPDFSLCLHLLPPSIMLSNARDGPDTSSLSESVRALNTLNNHLSAAEYGSFWNNLRRNDLCADLAAEVRGFDELMRVRIAAMVGQTVREVERAVLEEWLDLRGDAFEKFVMEICGWTVDESGMVHVPSNKDNEAKGVVVRENVKFDQFGRIVRRAYEQTS